MFTLDQVRSELILNESIPEGHPLRKFAYGNEKTLMNGEKKLSESSKLYSDLKAFHQSQYSADRMNLVISAEIPPYSSLEELKQWVQTSFGIIPNKKLGISDFGAPTVI